MEQTLLILVVPNQIMGEHLEPQLHRPLKLKRHIWPLSAGFKKWQKQELWFDRPQKKLNPREDNPLCKPKDLEN